MKMPHLDVTPSTGNPRSRMSLIDFARLLSVGFLALMILLVPGCGGEGSAEEDREPLPKIGEDPDFKIDGTWKLHLIHQIQGREGPILVESDLCIFEVKGDKVESIAISPLFSHFTFTSGKVDGTNLTIEFKDPTATHQFEGVGLGRLIRGTFGNSDVQFIPAKCARTTESEFSEQPKPRPVETDKLGGAMQSESARYASLATFIKENPDHPMIVMAYEAMLMELKTEETSETDIREIAQEFKDSSARWGKRASRWVDLKVASALARQKYLPKLALEYLEKATKILDEKTPPQFRREVGIAWLSLGKADEGMKLLEPLRSVMKNDVYLNIELAKAYLQKEEKEKAIELYSELAIYPQIDGLFEQLFPNEDLPSETLSRLWKEKHGNTDELEGFLEATYKKMVEQIGKSRTPEEAKPNQRTVLIELFTGSSCPPCVAADLALSSMEPRFAPHEAIFVKFHQHIPRHDPLASSDGTQRGRRYGIPGTPAIFANGTSIDFPAGGIDNAGVCYQSLEEQISDLLGKETEIKLELSAVAENGKLNITAKATGSPDDEDLRLRLVIVEDGIAYLAPNGIREHEGVARSMPGGYDGVAVEEGVFSYSESISLKEWKSKMETYLTRLEEDEAVSFPVKPFPLKKLRLVGFVQNRKTGEILQAGQTAVTGELNFE